MYNKILIRYGELTTKGKNRMHFIHKLESNLIRILNVKPETQFDRMFIDYSEINMKKLNYLFGISSFSPVIKVSTNLKEMKIHIFKLVEKELKNNSSPCFKIITKRHWKEFALQSNELNILIGDAVIKKYNLNVDVKNPKLKINIEIRKKNTYIFIKKNIGPGGYPVGINGKVLMMLSGGIDSPVASYNLMKRGLEVDFLSFVTPPYTDEKTIKKIKEIILLLNSFQKPATLFISNYTKLMHLIELVSKESYRITLMRRSFYRIATLLSKKYNYLAIANGENIGQVASQTLESINIIQNVTDAVILRPLLTADKQETINKGREIGTYEISIKKAKESCELFAPKKPIIKPTIFEAEKLEKEIPQIFEEEKLLINNLEKIQIN